MGLFYSKFLKTTFNKLNSFYKTYSLTEYSLVPIAKNFPLLRLPFLALLEVFKSLNPIELFILSQCSRRVTNYVHIVGTKKWKLSVNVGHKKVIINNKYTLIIVESSQKPTCPYDKNWKTLIVEYKRSENSKIELQKVLAQLQTAFRCPVTSFEYTGWGESDQCWVSALKCIIQNQVQPLESLHLDRHLKTEDLEWAFQNLKVTRKIDIRLYRINTFTANSYILSSSFLRPDLMIFKSCKCIELSFSWLPIRALNVFMEEWKAGCLPNLQYSLIKSDDFHWNRYDYILGFKSDEMSQLGVRRRLVIDEKQSIDCTGGRDIEADNGTKATMQMHRVSYDWFELFVWKK